MFALPDEEDGSVQEKEESKGKEKELTSEKDKISDSTESSDDVRPTRARRSPSWLLEDSCEVRKQQKKIDQAEEPSEDEIKHDAPSNNHRTNIKKGSTGEALKPKQRAGRAEKHPVSKEDSTSEEEIVPKPYEETWETQEGGY
ncbi:hypothetical protein P7C70_g7377, partial [Phenoliferia sp. Uapishka_3]